MSTLPSLLSSRLNGLSAVGNRTLSGAHRSLSMFCLNTPTKTCSKIAAASGNLDLGPTSVTMTPVRTRVYCSRETGQSETVEDVVKRFFRLHNGLWIRPKAGRNKKKWTKTPSRVHRLKFHVVCNRAQCQLLDKMVNREYRVKKFYADDPYAAYHRKSNLPDYRYQPPKFLP